MATCNPLFAPICECGATGTHSFADKKFPPSSTLDRQESVKEAPIPLQSNAQVLGRDVVPTVPLLFELRPFLRKNFRQPLHRRRNQSISLLHRAPRFIHKRGLNLFPAAAQSLQFIVRKLRRRLFTFSFQSSLLLCASL